MVIKRIFGLKSIKIKKEGDKAMEVMIKASPKNGLKNLASRSKKRREQMKNFVFTKKDNIANANFNDLEKEVYSNIK